MKIKRITERYCEQFHAQKFDNLNEMEQFLQGNKLPKLTEEEIANLNSTISITQNESIINVLPKQKVPGPVG